MNQEEEIKRLLEQEKEIKELLKQKKEIEKQIRALRTESTEIGLVRLKYETYNTYRTNEWKLSILCNTDVSNERRWRSIIIDPDKDVVIHRIDDVVRDLLDLKSVLVKRE